MPVNFSLTAPQKADARGAITLLEGTGISLLDAARRAIEGRRAVEKVTVADCSDRFIHSRLDRRNATVEWYTNKLGAFVAEFGARPMDGVSRAALRDWVAAQPVGESTKMSFARAVRAMWRWAIAQEPPLAGLDITQGMRVTPPRKGNSTGFLPVSEVEAILNGCPQYRDALVLMLFGGIRPHEIADPHKPPLLWRHIDVTERLIRIPGDIAKVEGAARIIEGLPDTLWRWLGTPGKPDEPVSRVLAPAIQQAAASAAGYGERCARERKWPHDAFRHTFATYMLALTSDAAKVSEWMGHEGAPRLLHRTYKGLTTKAEAEKFRDIAPREAIPVIPFAGSPAA